MTAVTPVTERTPNSIFSVDWLPMTGEAATTTASAAVAAGRRILLFLSCVEDRSGMASATTTTATTSYKILTFTVRSGSTAAPTTRAGNDDC